MAMLKSSYGKIDVEEIRPGVLQIRIHAASYGQAGEHWKAVLDKPRQGGYGRIYIQRFGADGRRRDACWEQRGDYRGCAGANLDECPGAMFIWTEAKKADVEAIDAIDNQTLGRHLRLALKPFSQASAADLWEVEFRFL
jgi:hypothetical protein